MRGLTRPRPLLPALRTQHAGGIERRTAMTPTEEIRIAHGGAVRTSKWITPRRKTRPVPLGCRIVSVTATAGLPDRTRARIAEIAAKHPRVRYVIAYTQTP